MSFYRIKINTNHSIESGSTPKWREVALVEGEIPRKGDLLVFEEKVYLVKDVAHVIGDCFDGVLHGFRSAIVYANPRSRHYLDDPELPPQ